MKIFAFEIFQKFHDVFSGFTLTRLTFLYVKHYLSFIYAYCSSLSLSAGLLAWFACLSIGSTVVIKLWLSSDYYDERRTRYSPVAVTEVKEGSVSSTGHPYSTLASSQSMFGMLKRWMLLNKWTTDNVDQNTLIQTKTNKSADIPFLLCSTDFTINARQKNLFFSN